MKIYNAVGYLIILGYMVASVYAAPAQMGLGTALLIAGTYFFFCWFFAGLYLADLLHLGIAHRSLDYKEWFMKTVTVVNNVFGLYVEPVSWVYRHRLHHKNADHDGDPNKLSGDGFWRTAYLCVMPYKCQEDLASDAAILQSRTFRLVGNPLFAIVVQTFSFYLLWKIAGSLKFALVMWFGMRIFAWWVNMIQNYWTHMRKFGYRRYDDDDNAMNIGEWFPVTATFSACLQNNHHHYPTLLRLSHDESEYDFGFLTVKGMKGLGLVKATGGGEIVPAVVPLAALDFCGGFFRQLRPFQKRFDGLPQKAGRDLFAVEAISFRPFLGKIIRSEKFIDPGKVDGEIFVDALFLRSGVPVIVSRNQKKIFDPFRVGAEV